MAQYLTNPDFADELTGWTIDGAVTAEDGSARVVAYRLFTGFDGGGQPTYSYLDALIWQAFTTVPGIAYDLSAWVKLDAGDTVPIVLAVRNPANAAAEELDTLDPADASGEWEELSGSFVATGTTAAFQVRADWGALTGPSTEWLIDDTGARDVAITANIRDAVKSDLEDITTANGFSITVQTVSSEPLDVDTAQKPVIYVRPGTGGTADEDVADRTLGNRAAFGTQSFSLAVFVQSTTPLADLDALTDDIRNAIERTTSATMVLAGVIDVIVTDWDETLAAADAVNNLFFRRINVSVGYEYTRGSA